MYLHAPLRKTDTASHLEGTAVVATPTQMRPLKVHTQSRQPLVRRPRQQSLKWKWRGGQHHEGVVRTHDNYGVEKRCPMGVNRRVRRGLRAIATFIVELAIRVCVCCKAEGDNQTEKRGATSSTKKLRDMTTAPTIHRVWDACAWMYVCMEIATTVGQRERGAIPIQRRTHIKLNPSLVSVDRHGHTFDQKGFKICESESY